MVSYRGQKKLGPRPDRSPLGFNSKFPTSIPPGLYHSKFRNKSQQGNELFFKTSSLRPNVPWKTVCG